MPYYVRSQTWPPVQMSTSSADRIARSSAELVDTTLPTARVDRSAFCCGTQRLCGYAGTVEGLGYVGVLGAPPASLLGPGGEELLKQEVESARPKALAN